MRLFSATDAAIRDAYRRGTLRIESHHSARLDELYWAIEDDGGVIEVALSEEEAQTRVRDCIAR